MRKGIFCFLIGILCCQLIPVLPPVTSFYLTPFLLVGMVRWPASRPLASLLLGFLWAMWRAQLILASPTVEPSWMGQDLVAIGWVESLPEARGDGLRFVFRPQALWRGDQPLPPPPRVLLRWYQARDVALRPGQWLALRVRLKPPGGYANPGGFDFPRWLLQHRIRATGYVRGPLPDSQQQHYLAQDSALARQWQRPPAAAWVNQLRAVLLDRLHPGAEPLAPGEAMVLALALGVTHGISREQWQTLRATGTTHLVAISGLHIGLLAGFGFFLLRWGWSRRPGLLLRCPAPVAGAVCAIVFAAGYSALAGFSVPTQRALVMVVTSMLLLIVQARLLPSQVLALAGLAVLAPGTWLSFAAVALILYTHSGRLRWQSPWFNTRIHGVVALGLAPLLLLYFQQLSLISPVANIVAVPWVSFIAVPLSLLATAGSMISIPLGQAVLRLARLSIEGLQGYLGWLATLPFAEVHLPSPSWLSLPLAVLALVWLLAPRGWPARWLGGVMLLPLCFPSGQGPAAGEAQFTLLDVGQGLAAVVRTARHTLVFDTGPRFGPDFDTGAAVLVPFLRQAGVDQVDTLVISHGDNDHVGGVESLLAALPTYQLISGTDQRPWRQPALSCEQERQWTWDGVRFTLFSPPGMTGRRRENNGSCVMQVRVASGPGVLLTGDIEAEGEAALLRQRGRDLSSEVLVVPHHGSATSSTADFIDAVQPRYALFPVGAGNRFGFPKPVVRERYQQRQITLLDTASAGAIRFDLVPGRNLEPPGCYRQEVRHYWSP